jgi:hypothetical protein
VNCLEVVAHSGIFVLVLLGELDVHLKSLTCQAKVQTAICFPTLTNGAFRSSSHQVDEPKLLLQKAQLLLRSFVRVLARSLLNASRCVPRIGRSANSCVAPTNCQVVSLSSISCSHDFRLATCSRESAPAKCGEPAQHDQCSGGSALVWSPVSQQMVRLSPLPSTKPRWMPRSLCAPVFLVDPISEVFST